MRHALMVALMMALTSSAHAEDGADPFGIGKKPAETRRERPASAVITAPRGFEAVTLPRGLRTEPPAERWWESAAPCPDGATLETRTEHTWTSHRCKDASGAEHGPYTELSAEGRIGTDGWREHGVDHGVKRTFWDNGTLTEQRIYVRGVAQGDAIMSRDQGPYRDGERHGLWIQHTPGGGELRGYYLKGKREGTWLGVTRERGQEIVIASATYVRDALASDVVWWTEDGDLLATLTVEGWSRSRQLQFYGSERKPTLKAACRGEVLVYLHQVVKREEITCHYDYDHGDLVQPITKSKRLACPADTASYHALCTADVLDPYAVAGALPRVTDW